MTRNDDDHTRLSWLAGAARLPLLPLSESLADLTERLMEEFQGQRDPAVISTAVLDSVRDLECAEPLSIQHIERLSRHRLTMTSG